jgi:hypothetical protein
MRSFVQLLAAVATAAVLFGAGAAMAAAESDGVPAILVLEGTVTGLKF